MYRPLCRWVGGVAVVSALALAAAPVAARSAIVYSARTSCRDIALTFDTEFSPTTQALIDTLDELNVKSTWFFLGEQVDRYAPIVRQVAARHEIGNHTFTHPIMPKQSYERMKWEIEEADAAITRVAGRSPRPLFRAPYGEWNNTLLDATGAEGYPYVFQWSIDTRDWAGRPAQEIRAHIVSHAFPGAIVLQHGSPANTVAATRLAVGDLRAAGYQFVTLTELLGVDRSRRDFGSDTYVVQPGDTWDKVAACHNLTGPRLQAYTGWDTLWAGVTLHIPHTDEVLLMLDGQRVSLPAYPRLEPGTGRVLVPVRLAEQLGATVSWDGASALIKRGETELIMTPAQQQAVVNGTSVDMGTAATLVEGRILVPARFLAEQLGAQVTWDAAAWTVSVKSPPPLPPAPAKTNPGT